MKICYFGNYNKEYSRTKVLRKGLALSGAKIFDCHSNKIGIRLFFDLYKKHRNLPEYDLIFIGNSGPSVFLPLLARLISTKLIVWEPLYSIYDNWIYDRKVASRFSLKALYYYFMDWVGVKSSDLIVLDTDSHHNYFIKTFGAQPEQLVTAYIGADIDVFNFENNKSANPKTVFEVEFHGKYIPVQGTEAIVKAADLLKDDKDIHFTMIGGGQMYKKTYSLAQSLQLKNITFFIYWTKNQR